MAKFTVPEDLGVTFTLLFCFTTLVLAGEKPSEDQIKLSQFDVKPGGQTHVHEESWNGVTCTLTYAAQGGTHENWSFGISRSGQNNYECTVERPGGNSYLYFLNFKVELKGGKVRDGKAYGNNERPLAAEEFKVEKGKNQISSQDGFKNELSKIIINAKKGKSEL